MAGFDLDAFREAHRPFVLRAGGREFPARWVSGEQVLAMVAAAQEGGPLAERALYRFLRLLWPWRWSYLRPGRDPVRLFARCTPLEQQEWLKGFFDHLAAMRAALDGSGTPLTPSSTAS